MWLLPRRAFLRNAPFSVSLEALDAAFFVEVSEAAAQWAGDEGLFSGLPDMRGCQISERVLKMMRVPCFTNSGTPSELNLCRASVHQSVLRLRRRLRAME